MYPSKKSSLVLLTASVIGVIAYFYLSNDSGSSEPLQNELVTSESTVSEISEPTPSLDATQPEEVTEKEAHPADCAHCLAAGSGAGDTRPV